MYIVLIAEESQMKSNPGGQLPLDEILGRDDFITSLWDALAKNSIRLEAERRIGKTHILRKMEMRPADGWVISLDVEKVHSAAEFAELIYRAAMEHLPTWSKHCRRAGEFLARFGGTEIGSIRFPEKKDRPEGYWKTLLTHVIEDLVKYQSAEDKRIVFFLDELPWMITAIAQRERAETATEVLDLLCALRQSSATGASFRVILCGSIGLHHVLATLKRGRHSNEPVNDIIAIEVPPLSQPDAVTLTQLLLKGEGLAVEPAAITYIAQQTGGFPYYIHWIIAELRKAGQKVTVEGVTHVVTQLLTAAHDPCNFRHFRERIDGYYPAEQKAVLAMLDHAAKADAPLSVAELINVAKSAQNIDDERARELLRLLTVDHYLIRDGAGHVLFRHVLLRQWWILDRGLS
jgi:hypothetical protein